MALFARGGFLRVYGFSLLVTAALIVTVGLTMGGKAMVSLLALSALEIIFSLDNAVVNAQIVGRMRAFWRTMFLTVGIVVAVFGVRLVLPLLIVAITARLDFGQAIVMAIDDPARYTVLLQAAHPVIAAFGGTFLLMNFLDFLFRRGKAIGQSVARLLAVAVLGGISFAVPASDQSGIVIAGLGGMGLYLLVQAISDKVARAHKQERKVSKALARGGLITFLYLEMLDASFSLDGVSGAFAITSNVVLIAAGLGVGAVWVRSMTIDLVKRGALQHYNYLDLTSHMAIGTLAALLLAGVTYELPPGLIAGVELSVIALSFLAVALHSRRVAKTGVLIRKALHSHRQ